MVDPKEWREIRDFAKINGFSISPLAERKLQVAIESLVEAGAQYTIQDNERVY